MTQRHDLFTIIKKQIRSQGITYKLLAKKLKLSEASIKRIFSQKDLSLSRLEAICSQLELSLAELFELLQKEKKRILHLSEKQEQELVSELGLLLVAICILNHWTFADILKFYAFSEHELLRYVARLDKMKFIELQPGNRFKRLVSPDFHWQLDGPIQRFFQEKVQHDFFNCNFDQPTEFYLVRSGMLSEQDNLLFQEILTKTANEFLNRCKNVDIPIENRHGTALVIAMRPWVPQIFASLKRKV